MKIFVNGQETDCPEECTVTALLSLTNVPPTGTAVARNETVVRKADYADTMLQPGDRIEIIHAVAGG